MKIISKVIEIFLRFPLAVSSFMGILTVMTYLDEGFEFQRNLDNTALETILPFLIIGFFLMFAVELYSETKNFNSIFLALPTIVLLYLYFLFLQSGYTEELKDSQINQIPLLFLISAALSAASLSISKGSRENFWQVKAKLFKKLLISAIGAMVLYEALSLFLQSFAIPMYFYFDFLYFYLPDIGENYSWMALATALTMATRFFLSEVPKNPEGLVSKKS